MINSSIKTIFNLFILIFLIISVVLPIKNVLAEESKANFKTSMLEWRKNSELAIKLLKEAEKELKSGMPYKACIKQRQASKYGIDAFKALKEAQKFNSSEELFENIEENLAKWKKLSDCQTTISSIK